MSARLVLCEYLNVARGVLCECSQGRGVERLGRTEGVNAEAEEGDDLRGTSAPTDAHRHTRTQADTHTGIHAHRHTRTLTGTHTYAI